MLESDNVSRHAVFHHFLSDNRKQDSLKPAEHSKHIIELLQNITVLFSKIINIWENTDGCAEKYYCDTALYLLSILAHEYNIIIDRGVGELGHGRYVVDGLNAAEKSFL